MAQEHVLVIARWAADGRLVSAAGPHAGLAGGTPAPGWRELLARVLTVPALRAPAVLGCDAAEAVRHLDDLAGSAARWSDGIGGTVLAELHELADGGQLLSVVHRPVAGAFDPGVLQEIIDILPATISIKDAERRYRFVNRAWLGYAGVPADAVLGRRHEDFAVARVAEQARASHTSDIADRDALVLATGKPLLGQEETFTGTDGIQHTLLSNKIPLADASGQFVGILSVTVDITDRIRAEAFLREAKEKAEAASLAKSEFLAAVSHELRTPLNGMLGMNTILLTSALDPEQRHWAEMAQRCAEDLSRLVNDVLDFSTIDAGHLSLMLADVDLVTLADEAAAPYAVAAEARGLALAVIVDPSARLVVRADPGRLRQILDNLISNAVKFTDAGHVVVTVSALAGAQPEADRIVFTVEDSGIGIPEAAQAQLFTMFHQVDSSSTRRHGGTGLGLAICRRLTELMGGTIGLQSAPGQGSRFRVDLPLRRVSTRPAPGPDLSGRGILVFGRTPAVRASLADRLAAAGAVVEQAADLVSAVAAFAAAKTRGRQFDAILVDERGLDAGTREEVRRLATAFGRSRPLLRIQAAGGEAGGGDPAIPWPGPETHLIERVAQVVAGEPAAGGAAPPRLLLVEDNEINRMVALGMLNRLGCTADVAVDGADAVQALNRNVYDLVLMDVRMPVMDGLEATRRIRALPTRAALVPIVALTANALQSDVEECLAAGMNDYIGKPVSLDNLGGVLRRWLKVAPPA